MKIDNQADSCKDAQEWYEKGKSLIRSKKYWEAITAFNSALCQNVELADAYLARGACYYLMGKYQRASADMDAAALLGCQDAQFWSKYESGLPADSEEESDND